MASQRVVRPRSDSSYDGHEITRLTPWERGEQILASKLNEVISYLNRDAANVIKPPSQVFPTTRPIITQVFIIKSILRDSLKCKTYSNCIEGTDDVYVMKPRQLMKTTYDLLTTTNPDGITFAFVDGNNRTATQSSYVETQRVTPIYNTDDQITAMANVAGTDGAEAVEAVGNVSVAWFDMNLDMRLWARVESF